MYVKKEGRPDKVIVGGLIGPSASVAATEVQVVAVAGAVNGSV